MKWLLLLTIAGSPQWNVQGINTISEKFETEALCRGAVSAHLVALNEQTAVGKRMLAQRTKEADALSYPKDLKTQIGLPFDVAWTCSRIAND